MNERLPEATLALLAPMPRLGPRSAGWLLFTPIVALAIGCADETSRAAKRPADAPERGEPRDQEEADDAVSTPDDSDDERDAPPARPPVAIDAGSIVADAGRDAAREPSDPVDEVAEPDVSSEADASISSGSDAGEDATTPAAKMRCRGKPGAKRGKSTETLRVGGAMRKFIMHRPSSLDADAPAPIVIVPHGFTQNAEDMYRITKYWELGEKEGMVTLYPDGASAVGPWNVGRPTCQSVFGTLPLGSANDQAFIEELVNFVEADQCVDREHVFVAGFSMGGYFANETGCKSELVRAIAPHSAGSYDLASCKSKIKPVIMFHGDGDRLIPYACGKQTRERWVKRNGCSAEVEVRMVRDGSCEYHKGCMEGGQVAFCTLNAMNHGWAGGPTAQVPAYPDDYPKFESSTRVSWDFFKTYAW